MTQQLEIILEDESKCEKFGEHLLDEICSDDDSAHHIGRKVIEAYQARDCDAILIALCGWSMASLIERFEQ